MEFVAALRQQTDSLNQRQKEAAPKGGGFRWICVLGVGLEEDDAADLEQIPIIEALAYVLLAEGGAAIVKDSGFGDARQVEIDLLVLPPRVDMHGRCVDLLHHAKAPALHF